MYCFANLKYLIRRRVSCLVVALLCGVVGPSASAYVDPSVTCSGSPVSSSVLLGAVRPGTMFQLPFASGTCRTDGWYPLGGYYTQTQSPVSPSGNLTFIVVAKDTRVVVPSDASGSQTACFVPSNCRGELLEGSVFPYDFFVVFNAERATGIYSTVVTVYGYSPIDNVKRKAKIAEVTYTYIVVEPACSIGSATSLALQFGTLSPNDVGAQRTADITVNCLSGVTARARLVPTQSAVGTGLSATSLEGLSMAATWADNGQAVDFNVTRSFSLSTGSNLISLNFRPVVNAGALPTGAFSSQYTLNLTYP